MSQICLTLDTTVLVLAYNPDRERPDKGLQAAELVKHISKECHRIAVSNDILEEYYRTLNRYQYEANRNPLGIRIWRYLFSDRRKLYHLYRPLSIANVQVNIHDDDKKFLAVAALTQSRMVVTEDSDYFGIKDELWIKDRSITILHIDEALERLKSANPSDME